MHAFFNGQIVRVKRKEQNKKERMKEKKLFLLRHLDNQLKTLSFEFLFYFIFFFFFGKGEVEGNIFCLTTAYYHRILQRL